MKFEIVGISQRSSSSDGSVVVIDFVCVNVFVVLVFVVVVDL